ncbi:hypothetical protein ACIRL2_46730 [Embleya sp. NPDC127516]|uniref:hypothetical protein n=1 Tax=Embleya sp. NPDC127516 TaxID=3363990 RepID=UPI00381C3282
MALRQDVDAERLARRYADLETAARATLPLAHPEARRALNAVRERAGERATELRRFARHERAAGDVASNEACGDRTLARSLAHSPAQARARARAAVRESRGGLDAAYAAWRAGAEVIPRWGDVTFAALDQVWSVAQEGVSFESEPEFEAVSESLNGADAAAIAERIEERGEACLTLAHHARTLAARPQSSATRAHLHEVRVHAEHTARALRDLAHLTNPPLPYTASSARPARPQLTAHTLGPLIARAHLARAVVPDLANEQDCQRFRDTYRADRVLMRAVWHHTWWTRATPDDIAHAWATTSRWATFGSAYAATTLRHLRGRVRQYTGLETRPPNQPPLTDPIPTLAIGPIHPPHGDTVWWRCAAHDPTTRPQLLAETREPATAWEHPDDVAARVHADLEHVHRLRPDVLRRVHITTTREVGDPNRHPTHQSHIRGTDVDHIRRKAAQRHQHEHHVTQRATLLRRDLDTAWRSNATPTEINAIQRETQTWAPGPARSDILTFLQRHT